MSKVRDKLTKTYELVKEHIQTNIERQKIDMILSPIYTTTNLATWFDILTKFHSRTWVPNFKAVTAGHLKCSGGTTCWTTLHKRTRKEEELWYTTASWSRMKGRFVYLGQCQQLEMRLGSAIHMLIHHPAPPPPVKQNRNYTQLRHIQCYDAVYNAVHPRKT